jgi:two-component system chemotaxis response regulator CheY
LARVLIADDAAIVRKVLREMLETAGHTVIGDATTGNQAVALHDHLRPDVTILDVNMPDLDGLSAAETIRQSYPTAALVVTSVLVNQTRLNRVKQLGHVEYLSKPFQADTLLNAITRATT